MFGNRYSSMLRVTLPRNPVPPIRNIRRLSKISVGESLLVMIPSLLPLPWEKALSEGHSLVWRRNVSTDRLPQGCCGRWRYPAASHQSTLHSHLHRAPTTL